MKFGYLVRDTEGAALVEFTVTLPLFLALTFGTIQAGLMLWSQVGLQHGVEMAARCASVSDSAVADGKLPTPCYAAKGNATANAASVASYAAANSWGLKPPASVFSVNPATPSCPAGNLVTASYPFTAITYLYKITLSASSCYPAG